MPPPVAKKATGAKKAANKAPAKKGAAKKAAGGANAAQQNQPTIDALLDQAVVQAQSALTEYRVLAENAAHRLSGEDPQPTTTWADDITKFWGMVMRDQMGLVNLWGQLMQRAAKA